MGMDHNDGGQGNEMTGWRLWCSTWSWSILSLTTWGNGTVYLFYLWTCQKVKGKG
jgi:hypothetical protein